MIQKIAPLSYQIMGEAFFKTTLPSYFREVPINLENPLESILYFPLYLKKFSSDHKAPEYVIELMDYEYVKYQLQSDESTTSLVPYSQTTTEIYLNPIAQAIRHEYDVHGFVCTLNKGWSKKVLPKKSRTLLLVSKSPTSKDLTFLKGNIYHAAIIDQLQDGKMLKKNLLMALHTDHPNVPQSEWIVALKSLKEIYFTLEA